MYTTRETSQPAPITAAGTGYRVPAISSDVKYGVRFSVKLACARWAYHAKNCQFLGYPSRREDTARGVGLTAVQLERGRVRLGLLFSGVRVRVADALYHTQRGGVSDSLRLAGLVLTAAPGDQRGG